MYAFLYAAVSDMEVYFRYALQGVDRDLMPYRDIQRLEYPPLAYWTVRIPRALSSWRLPPPDELRIRLDPEFAAEWKAEVDRHFIHYDWGFRFQMLLADLAAFALFGLVVARRRPTMLVRSLWLYNIVGVLLSFLLYDRLDIGLTFFLMAWAYCWVRAGDADGGRGWAIASYAALGLGISYKLVPVLMVPFVLLCEWRTWRRTPRQASMLLGPIALAITALGPFVYYYIRAGKDLRNMFDYHSLRGVQVESTYSSLMMLLEPTRSLQAYHDFGSWNLGGRWESFFVTASPWITIGLLGLLGLRCLLYEWSGSVFDRSVAYRFACVVLPVAAATSKVLSPQYFLWLLPLLILAAVEYVDRRRFVWHAAAVLVICAASTFLFPFHYVDTMPVWPYDYDHRPRWALMRQIDEPPEGGHELVAKLSADACPIVILVFRNLLFVGLTLGAVYDVLRRRPAAEATTPARE